MASTQASGASTTATSYTYDKAGNTTGRATIASGNQTLTWNDAGQLTQISGGKSGTTSYIYDADGNVLLQTDPTSTTLYLPGQQLTLTGTTTGVRSLPLPGGGTVVRTGTAANYKFTISDRHGTSGLYLDSTAQTPSWRQFTPYGGPRGTTASWIDNRGFLNAPDNTNTGLTQLGARQYDPTLGRFVSLDPLFLATDDRQLRLHLRRRQPHHQERPQRPARRPRLPQLHQLHPGQQSQRRRGDARPRRLRQHPHQHSCHQKRKPPPLEQYQAARKPGLIHSCRGHRLLLVRAA
ncbi:hypothetical protein ACF05L_37805 [Streptomyces bobili]|uniref:hypothetical protein n=1 Tax=Streptomyces bobili TaxID=67280 RepID=UPI003701A9EC